MSFRFIIKYDLKIKVTIRPFRSKLKFYALFTFLFIYDDSFSIHSSMNTLKQSNTFTYIVVGIMACVAVYYFKDLSLALGKTDEVSLSLSAWIW